MEDRMETEITDMLEKIICKDRGHFWIGDFTSPNYEVTLCKESETDRRAIECERCGVLACQHCYISNKVFSENIRKSTDLGIHDMITIWRN